MNDYCSWKTLSNSSATPSIRTNLKTRLYPPLYIWLSFIIKFLLSVNPELYSLLVDLAEILLGVENPNVPALSQKRCQVLL